VDRFLSWSPISTRAAACNNESRDSGQRDCCGVVAALFRSAEQITCASARLPSTHPTILRTWIHGYLCRAAIPVSHSSQEGIVAYSVIGWYLDRSGQIPINTRNPRTTLSSLGVGVKALRSGMPLFVFPEGARTTTGELQNFLSGALTSLFAPKFR